jgi:hypothetical protein
VRVKAEGKTTSQPVKQAYIRGADLGCSADATPQKKRPQEARPEAASFESGVRVSVVPAFHRSEVERPPRTIDSLRDND